MGKSRFPKPDQSFTQDLRSSDLSFTTSTRNKPFHLDQVTFKFNRTSTGTITITLDSVKGSDYDSILLECPYTDQKDFVYRPQGEAIFNAGDEIKVECDGVGTVFGIVKTSEIN